MTVQFKENRKTYKVKRFPASATMNIKAGLCRQLPGLEAALANGVPGGCPLVCPLLLHRVLSLLVTSLERGQQPWFGRGGTRVVPTCTHVPSACAHPPLSVLVCHPPASWCCLRPPTHGCPSLPAPGHPGGRPSPHATSPSLGTPRQVAQMGSCHRSGTSPRLEMLSPVAPHVPVVAGDRRRVSGDWGRLSGDCGVPSVAPAA